MVLHKCTFAMFSVLSVEVVILPFVCHVYSMYTLSAKFSLRCTASWCKQLLPSSCHSATRMSVTYSVFCAGTWRHNLSAFLPGWNSIGWQVSWTEQKSYCEVFMSFFAFLRKWVCKGLSGWAKKMGNKQLRLMGNVWKRNWERKEEGKEGKRKGGQNES